MNSMAASRALETAATAATPSPASSLWPESTSTTSSSSSRREASSLWLARAAAARAEAADAAVAMAQDYRPELSTPALIAEVRLLLFSERRAGRLVCRYLADLADRIQARRDGE